MHVEPLNTTQLQNMLKCINVKVTSAEGLPLVCKNACFVLNLSYLNEPPGSHWYYFETHNDKLIIFDSLALNFVRNDQLKYMKKCKKKLVVSRKRLQGDSSVCGYYSIAFSFFRYFGGTLPEFVKLFGRNRVENDRKVVKLVQKLIGNPHARGGSCSAFLRKIKKSISL
jgi:hypothetical protein